jgi:hypothetical protein
MAVRFLFILAHYLLAVLLLDVSVNIVAIIEYILDIALELVHCVCITLSRAE